MVFWSLFNHDWKTAAQTLKFKFPVVFCFIWHPAWPQGRESRITSKTALFEIIFRANTPVCISLDGVLFSEWDSWSEISVGQNITRT